MPSKPKPLCDNPHSEEYRLMADDGRRFQVLHLGVGPHAAGKVVSAKELGEGAQLPRLVELNAIRELSESEVHDLEDAETSPGGTPPISHIQPTGTGPVPPGTLANPPASKPDGGKDKG